MNTQKRIQNVAEMVEAVLCTVPESRNSDITLTIEVWKSYCSDVLMYHPETNEPYVSLARLFDLPREDHIKRIRAKIQNVERRYLPTKVEILIERAKLSDEWKQFLGYTPYWREENWQKYVRDYMQKREEEEKQPLLF